MNKKTTNKTGKKKLKRKKHLLSKIIIYTLLVLLITGIVGIAVTVHIVRSIIAETPPIEVYDINMLLSENSEIFDSKGTIIEKVNDGSIRTIIPFDKIDKDIINAFIAVEDKTFFEHEGFNYVRLVGATIGGIMNRRTPAGTSTITQQYARNMYLPETRFARGLEGVVRKIKEAYYTIEIEKHLDKNQILAAYLNTIELGANVKGIEAATQRYFSKSADDIDYIEAAILAGIPQANTSYSPFKTLRNEDVSSDDYILGEQGDEYTVVFNEKMLGRYKTVIAIMRDLDVITEEEYNVAKNTDVRTKLKLSPFMDEDISSYFTDMVKKEVLEKLVSKNNMKPEDAHNLLYNGGLRIYSTLDIDMQKKLEASYNAQEFTNDFDEATRQAAIAFQKKYELGVDGVIGPNTIAKFVELGLLDKSKITLRVFRKGHVNDEVLLIKKALEKTGLLYKRNNNLPSIRAFRDSKGNILNVADVGNGLKNYGISLLLNDKLIDKEDNLVVHPDEYEKLENGDIVLKKGKSFNFYMIKNSDGSNKGIEAFIKDSYKADPSFVKRMSGATRLYNERVSIREMYIFKGKNVIIPFEYKKFDDKRNLVISAAYLNNKPDFITINENNELLINKKYYSISRNGIIQPQSAMVVIDYRNGHLKSILGGRNVSGQMIFNRAENPRPPGSAIKPISVYMPALDNGYTAASVFDDVPEYTDSNKRWPLNWYEHQNYKYWGLQTLREAVEWSENIIPVKLIKELGIDKSIEYLKKLGITTVVEKGNSNDINPAALALGGMTKGISPIELAAAFGTIANNGVRNETITFTKVTDKHGNLIMENIPKQTFVIDEQVASITHSILKSSVDKGLARNAQMFSSNSKIPVAGKTGTTSKNIDAWFVGYTPYYVSSMWVGNDVQISLSDGSSNSAKYWSKISRTIHSNLEDKKFKSEAEAGLLSVTIDRSSGMLPSELSYKDTVEGTIGNEWFVPGTQPTEIDNTHVELDICTHSGRIAGPYCPPSSLSKKVFRTRKEEDFDPFKNTKTPYSIRDDQYTIPKMYIEGFGTENARLKSDIDFVKISKTYRLPFCDLHYEPISESSIIVKGYKNVEIKDLGNGNKIFAQNIILNTKSGDIKVLYGSRMDADGVIRNTEGTYIQPSQILSYQLVEGGEKFYINEEETDLPLNDSQDENSEDENSENENSQNENNVNSDEDNEPDAPDGY